MERCVTWRNAANLAHRLGNARTSLAVPASNDARWARWFGAGSSPKGACSMRLRHTIGGRRRLSPWTQGALSRTTARTESRHRDGLPYGAMLVAIAPGRTMLRQCKLTAAFYRLNLRPVRARRLSKAGRHWAPIARQRATREERQSGRTWPTYCNKPNWVPPSSTAWCALSPSATAAVKPKTVFRSERFS